MVYPRTACKGIRPTSVYFAVYFAFIFQRTNELRVITGDCIYINAADGSLHPYLPHGVI